MNDVAELQAARRYITGVLLNLDINVNEMTVGTLLTTLDYLIDHPDEYKEIING